MKQSYIGESRRCPNCKEIETVYVHLDHKEEDPIAPKYWCVSCKHEWDENEDRL